MRGVGAQLFLLTLLLSTEIGSVNADDAVERRAAIARLIARTDTSDTWKPPHCVVLSFLESVPPRFLSDIDTCCEAQDTYDRLDFESTSSRPDSETWAAYATEGGRGVLAVLCTQGDSAITEAFIDSLGPIIPPMIRTRDGSKLGFDGAIISVAGNFGGMELMAWDGKRLHLLTPSWYDSGVRFSSLTGGLKFEDVDGDSSDEFVSNVIHTNDTPSGRRTWSQERIVYKYNERTHALIEISREWIRK
jgi:hypothetical protein